MATDTQKDAVHTQEQDILSACTTYYVLSRFGWGWDVRGPNDYKSVAFGTRQEAVDHARLKIADSGA